MHVSNVNEILFMFACDANRVLPLMYQFENLGHGGWSQRRGAFRESSDQLIEEFLGRDLEVEREAAILYENVEQE